MNNHWQISALLAIAAYLLGAVPFGYLVAKARGIDIRQVGSGNIGATNVFRAVGKSWGMVTLLLDVAKGFAAVYFLPLWLLGEIGADTLNLRLISGLMAICGHNWTVFLRFRGGKGVATSLGVLLGLAPAACLIALAAWILTALAWRYVSLASIVAAAVAAIVAWPLYLSGSGPLLPAILNLLAILAIVRHRSNISRLMAGTENRFGKR